MTIPKPCDRCPWTSTDEEVKKLMTYLNIRSSALSGAWFCCHVNMGTCYGAQRYAQAKAANSAKHEHAKAEGRS